jgi:hypothetical protein
MSSPRLSVGSRLDFVTYVGQLAVPAIAVGAVASAVVTGRKRSLVTLVVAYLGVSAGLGWDALRWERGADGRALRATERARRTIRVSLFNGLWLGVVPQALVNMILRPGPVPYEKMEHDGAGATEWER